MQLEQRPEIPARKAYDRANWSDIETEIQTKLHYEKQIESQQQLDEAVAELTTRVQEVIDRHVPMTRPSTYAKR